MLVNVPMPSIKPPMVEPSLRHGDEQFARLSVLEQTDGEVTLVTRDVELVRERGARVRRGGAATVCPTRPANDPLRLRVP